MSTQDKAHPYMKFYGRDWLGDSMLRMCTPEERGVWIDMLCIMSTGTPYGHLAVNGRAMSDADVARVIGMDEATYKGILYRLEQRGIPSRTPEGILYNRRLVREHQRFVTGSRFGKKGGGNPILHKDQENTENTDTRSHIPYSKGGLKVPYKGTFIGSGDSENRQWTIDECKNAAAPIGIKDEQVQAFFDCYASVGWIDSMGRPIVNLAAALGKWKANESSHGKRLSAQPEAAKEPFCAWCGYPVSKCRQYDGCKDLRKQAADERASKQ